MEADPRRALAALEAHAREFPRGQLSPEREVLRFEVLGRLGRVDEATTRGNALLTEETSRLYERRVRRVLRADPQTQTSAPER